eukprot:CAMPEP_0167788878 /NCGR_PEP_ID=MMETSP0111_2-20121227/10315_1 /TAXON_ID=91324 /ORGANISM="Lotharella globosa, Strain CCCM811" /LENGTH=420 /DNA_ID=CAMNT_0007680865 /DNA_START=140 /DNA_END=1402 /DNA_ORIENTATION=-
MKQPRRPRLWLANAFRGGKTDISGSTKVGIVGGGIGGLAAAIALKNIGITPTVYEKREAYENFGSGTGICIAPNGFLSLKRIDAQLHTEVVKSANLLKELEIEVFGKAKVDDGPRTFEEKYGNPGMHIRWAGIHRILMDRAMELGIPIKFGQSLRQIEREGKDGRVVVKFTDDTKDAESFDLLVGADGINSEVRRQCFSSDNEPERVGRFVIRATIPESENMPPCRTTVRDPKHATLFLKLGSGWHSWAATTRYDMNDPQHIPKSGEEAKAFMLSDEFKLYPEIQNVAKATPANEVFCTDIRQMRGPLKEWVQRNIVLLGDAAHAMSPALGQGANMALEDAAQLAQSLSDCKSLEDSLRQYEGVRKPRVKKVFDINNAMGRDANEKNEDDKEQSMLRPEEIERFLYESKAEQATAASEGG